MCSSDLCTFKVGNVTVGTLSSVPTDNIVTPQDLAGVIRSATSSPAALAIAQFLQSLDDGSGSGVINIPAAVTTALNLAKPLGAKVTALHVIPPYAPPVYADAMIYVPELDPKEYKAATEGAARKALAAVEKEAAKAGVPCSAVHIVEEIGRAHV